MASDARGSPTHRRVVVIDDDESDVRIVRDALAKCSDPPFVVESAGDLEGGLPLLAGEPAPVLLLDLCLPNTKGLETLRLTQRVAPLAPTVVLTGLDDELVALGAMELGAQYYLTKDRVNTETLQRAIKFAIVRKTQERDAEFGRIARSTLRDILQDIFALAPVDRLAAEDVGRRMALRVATADARSLPRLASELGLGQLVLISHENGRYEFEGHDMLEVQKGQRMPTCRLAVGFLSGYVGRMNPGAAVLASEMACGSRGDPACRFVIQQRHE